MGSWVLRAMAVLATVLLLAPPLRAQPKRLVKVAVFPHAPAISMGEDGRAMGFYVDMLQEVAAREDWELRFVPGTWQEGLDRVRSGEVDLVTSAARTPERILFLDYCAESSFTVWSILYAHPGTGIQTVLDVRDRRIGLIRGDVNGEHFQELCAQFSLPVTYKLYGSYVDVLRAVEAGRVDGGVTTNTFGYSQESKFRVERTPVVFSPFDIYFAVAKGQNRDLLVALDIYISQEKQNPGSGYHRVINRWLAPQAGASQPLWAIHTGLGVLFALFLAVLTALAFRQRVDRATKKIRVLNAGLKRELAEKQRMEEQILLVASGVSSSYGKTFFQDLVKQLAQVTGADVAFVGEILQTEERDRVHTLAVHMDGAPAKDMDYSLADSPCDQLSKAGLCVIPQGVQAQFPRMACLKQLGAEAYVAAPLVDSRGKARGLLAVIHRSPLASPGEAASILRIFSSRAASELERRSNEEAQQLLERQVQHAQKLESLGVLAGGIAHDFNNLLTAMLGHMNLARMQLAPESPALPHLAGLERIIQRAADLTRQMLAYSGKGRFVVRSYDLNQVVQEVTHILAVAIAKKIVLRFDLAPALPMVEADAAQIQQVVMNLVTNAADAIGDQDGTIRLSTNSLQLDRTYLDQVFQGQDLAPGHYVALEVSDTGGGMSPEVLGRIFEPFYTTKATGRGLGLSATIGILKGHQAGLRIYSELGRGTTFKLLFPTREPDGEVEAAPLEVPTLDREATVLLVDDEVMILETVTAVLQSLGLSVLTATNGLEALEIVRRPDVNVDVVLMDLTMPHMDGREAFQAIHGIYPDLPVILSSGYEEHESILDSRGVGLAAFLHKPYTLLALERTVLGVLAKRT